MSGGRREIRENRPTSGFLVVTATAEGAPNAALIAAQAIRPRGCAEMGNESGRSDFPSTRRRWRWSAAERSLPPCIGAVAVVWLAQVVCNRGTSPSAQERHLAQVPPPQRGLTVATKRISSAARH
jgi:hypothetical protein